MEILKRVITSKYLILSLILLIGLLCRLIGIVKQGGLWYDEVITYTISNKSFPFGILNKLHYEDNQAPLYYFILHFWMKLFGDGSTVLRFLSVSFGMINIYVMYFVGKELSGRKLGYLLAAFVSINSFLIYFSQEVRHYSLLALVSTLSILFMLRILKTPNLFNYTFFVLSNLAIVHTFPLGIIFIALESFFLFIYLFLKDKSQLKNYIYSQIITIFLCLPYITELVYMAKNTSKSIVGHFWWIEPGLASPFLIFQSWFSPVLVNIRSHDINYYNNIFSNGLTLSFILFITVPMLIYAVGIVKGISKKNSTFIIFLTGISFIILELIFAMFDKAGIMARHTTPALPALLIISVYGLTKINNKIISGILISSLLLINSYYIIFSSNSAPKELRHGYKYVTRVLDKLNLNKEDVIIIPYGARFFDEYYKNNRARVFQFDVEKIYCLGQDLEKVFDANLIKKISANKANKKELLRSYISSPDISKPFEDYVKKEVINKLKKNNRVVIVMMGGIDSYNEKDIKLITSSDSIYNRKHLFFYMLTSKNIIDLFTIMIKYDVKFTKYKEEMGIKYYLFEKI